ncbi:nucleophile aminohydrolase [Dactylonectria macrodidyma]|uniref:Nucleophile aminohydrolase n=1 Tax=Dactylonectria macrodidyma TaxID=307937 RepID=A0A9P9FIH6_9HYPO|nr:nucleophile aminohydrolase [Dactylonectria macrodidyma]
MEYRVQESRHFKLQPRIIIHGGAGNIQRENYPPEKYQAYRDALITIITKTNAYMTTPAGNGSEKSPASSSAALLPSALDVATFAVALLEDNTLFNSGHGAVFTRDGVNELEASVMVSRGRDKRGVGVMGLRRVRNPIALARAMLEHGQDDLRPGRAGLDVPSEQGLDVPSAQGHTQLFGAAAEQLAADYGLDLVDPDYFFTQQRWDEHRRALDRERKGESSAGATWSAEEYLPQGTCGAVALDGDGVICVATSTGGMTNKLTGRIGDTPVVGAGFWAEEWTEDGHPTGASAGVWHRLRGALTRRGPSVVLGDALAGALADCLPTPQTYAPLPPWQGQTTTTRSIGGSGTGNGDSFLRINALRTVGALARWKPEAGAAAVTRVAGPGGELELSAGDRWGRTGEGEGGVIGIECAVVRDAAGRVVDARSEILMDYNCGGMFRAWIDDHGEPVMSIWTNGASDDLGEQVTGGKR